MRPLFSPRGRYPMGSYETGFVGFDVSSGQIVFSVDQFGELEELWSTGLGWVTDRCIALKAGRDYRQADLELPFVLNWHSRRMCRIAVIGGAGAEVLGLDVVSFPYAIRQTN